MLPDTDGRVPGGFSESRRHAAPLHVDAALGLDGAPAALVVASAALVLLAQAFVLRPLLGRHPRRLHHLLHLLKAHAPRRKKKHMSEAG